MGIETSVHSDLWDAVRKSYEECNYTAAILDSIQYLGDVLRDKTGLASDGMSLVGDALGGNKPKLRINRLETETDKNVQHGIENLVRGLYQAFRNPRAHERHTDHQDDADVVLSLVSYLLKVVGQSTPAFERNIFLQRVFDAEFVCSDRYAAALAAEVPKKYRYDLLVDIYRARTTVRVEQLAFMIEALWRTVTEQSRSDFAAIVSVDLNLIAKSELGNMIALLPADLWSKCTQAARIRSENMLLGSIEEGRYDEEQEIFLAGELGAAASKMMGHWLLKSNLDHVVARRLRTDDPQVLDYIFRFVLPWVPDAVEAPSQWLLSILQKGLEQGDPWYRQGLEWIDYRGYDEEKRVDMEYLFPKWREALGDALAKYEQQARARESALPA